MKSVVVSPSCWLKLPQSAAFTRRNIRRVYLLVATLAACGSGQFTAPHIQWTRNNITIPETAQLPHLMVKMTMEAISVLFLIVTILVSANHYFFQGGEVITTRPYKVDTGLPFLMAIGSPLVALPALQPVILQVEAMGEYDSIQWQAPISGNQAIVHFNHQTIPTEEGFVQHCSQTVIGTNSNLTTNATSNHFRITEYASFNPDRISNSIPNLSVNSVPHITSSPLQDSQTPAITEAPSYAIVQPKTKRSSQPLDSQGSLQDTQCSNTTAQTTEEVDFISGSSAKNVLLLPKTYETCVPSGQGEAGMQQKVEPNTVCSNEITEKAPSLKGSSSFCCKESDMQTLSQDIPRAETIKNNSFSTIIKKTSCHLRI
eukprot:Em0004g1255a